MTEDENNNVESALTCFQGTCNCAQAIITTYCPKFGLDPGIALRLATGFGGGIARFAEVCGAVSGAVMVLGLKYGMKNADDTAGRDKTYEMVTELNERFIKRHGSILCRDILGCDIHTPEGKAEAKERDVFKTRCPGFVRSAAELLEEIL